MKNFKQGSHDADYWGNKAWITPENVQKQEKDKVAKAHSVVPHPKPSSGPVRCFLAVLQTCHTHSLLGNFVLTVLFSPKKILTPDPYITHLKAL